MKAWEMEKELMQNAIPKVLSEEEQTWDEVGNVEINADAALKLLWGSNVPGSGAPERVIVAGVQDMGNRGMDVTRAEELIPLGLDAHKKNDMIALNSITSRLYFELNNAPKDLSSEYWTYKEYGTWTEYENNVTFTETIKYDVNSEDFKNKIYAAWVAQICGGALGTAIEGFTTENIRKVFGDIRGYVRKPNTFNDDITYELAFLKAFDEKGYNISSNDIAQQWIGLIPSGWSAEEVALRNIKYGILPPQSGYLNNPYYEWIGAQMRGAICGMVAPGNPKEAARLAFIDGVVSHYNNGVIGEIFNAIIVSLAFVENDVRSIVKKAIDMMPSDSEYYSVVKFAYDKCTEKENWEEAWRDCEVKYEKYNWIHAYPNAAAEVIALWFGNGSFDETMNIIAMAGQDVDCNAAQIGTVIGIINGMDGIDSKWTEPIGDDLYTYVRSMKHIKITELAGLTVKCVLNAWGKL